MYHWWPFIPVIMGWSRKKVMYCSGMRTLLNVKNIWEVWHTWPPHHMWRWRVRMRVKTFRIIHIIIITSFKQQLQFVIKIVLLTRTVLCKVTTRKGKSIIFKNEEQYKQFFYFIFSSSHNMRKDWYNRYPVWKTERNPLIPSTYRNVENSRQGEYFPVHRSHSWSSPSDNLR